MKSDYYPLPEIFPWISTLFVSEDYRGNRISGKLIDFANQYAKNIGFDKTYIPTEFIGLYEKYGYCYVKDMDIAEDIASRYSDTVYLGVGVHNGYGSAQRMYVKRGYIPDGTGVWYRGSVCPQYTDCCNDDDLVLYLSKKLR